MPIEPPEVRSARLLRAREYNGTRTFEREHNVNIARRRLYDTLPGMRYLASGWSRDRWRAAKVLFQRYRDVGSTPLPIWLGALQQWPTSRPMPWRALLGYPRRRRNHCRFRGSPARESYLASRGWVYCGWSHHFRREGGICARCLRAERRRARAHARDRYGLSRDVHAAWVRAHRTRQANPDAYRIARAQVIGLVREAFIGMRVAWYAVPRLLAALVATPRGWCWLRAVAIRDDRASWRATPYMRNGEQCLLLARSYRGSNRLTLMLAARFDREALRSARVAWLSASNYRRCAIGGCRRWMPIGDALCARHIEYCIGCAEHCDDCECEPEYDDDDDEEHESMRSWLSRYSTQPRLDIETVCKRRGTKQTIANEGLVMGLEWETSTTHAREDCDKLRGWVACEDCSVSGELKSPPMTEEAWRKLTTDKANPKQPRALRGWTKASKIDSCAGVHVHIDRKTIGQGFSWRTIVHRAGVAWAATPTALALAITGRTKSALHKWAHPKNQPDARSPHGVRCHVDTCEKYSAVNVLHARTIEFRVWASGDGDTAREAIEATASILRWCSLVSHVEAKQGLQGWVAWVQSDKHRARRFPRMLARVAKATAKATANV